jgi:hypothetical protein
MTLYTAKGFILDPLNNMAKHKFAWEFKERVSPKMPLSSERP